MFRKQAKSRLLLVVMPLLLIGCLLVSACSAQVRSSVTERFRDRAKLYDGHWTAYLVETKVTQTVTNWKLSCRSLFESLPINVDDGILTVRLNNIEHATNVSANGRFRLEIPTKLKPAASPASADNLVNAYITLILQGALKGADPEGRFIVGISSFANQGCTSRIRYLRAFEKPV